MGILVEQIKKYFEESFPQKTESQLLVIKVVDIAIGKAQVLVPLFKLEFYKLQALLC